MRPLGVAPPAGREFAPEVTGVAVFALHNLAVHCLLPSPTDAVMNVVTATGLTAFARRAGCSHDDLGIGAADAAAGLRFGLAAATVATGVVALAASLPATRPFFRDRRVIEVGRRETIYHLAVRIPLATALAEELTFRGALLGLARRRHSAAAAVGWTSLLFGASHALPTLKHYDGNPASGLVVDPRKGRWVAVLGTMLSTAGAGYLFAWLRLRSHSVLAPILAHAATNASAYLAGRWVVRHTSKDGASVAADSRARSRHLATRSASAILGEASAAQATAVVKQGGQEDVSDPRAFLPVGRGLRHHRRAWPARPARGRQGIEPA